jgi:hypothetical protein
MEKRWVVYWLLSLFALTPIFGSLWLAMHSSLHGLLCGAIGGAGASAFIIGARLYVMRHETPNV